MKILRVILGDQLNAQHSWYQEQNDDHLYLIAELHQEQQYVRHHVQKIVAFFISMYRFAQALTNEGHQVLHLTLDQTAEYDSIDQLIIAVCQQHKVEIIEFQRPDEIRLLEQLRKLKVTAGIALREVDTEHFLLPFEEISKEFKPQCSSRMEAFYRRMRKRYGYLMYRGKPEGERWNFDSENRKALKASDLAQIPQPLCFNQSTQAVLERLDRHKISYFGEISEALVWPTSRKEALQLLEFFCTHCLPLFGQFQDAMTANSEYKWSLYHSRLSFALNTKMISPALVIERSISEYRNRPELIDLAQIEGFVRQILGWREFVRGIYWINLPEYSTLNLLAANKDLPEYFWSGKTKMRCMEQSLGQSLDYAYAHHIQRLMVIGNFALLVGIDPDQVDAWYLGVYIDAIEWVEMPNTRGMSQFADGGLLASKPYSSSGQYINRMSDYCKSCFYDVKLRTGNRSCPFNSLYWHFHERHKARFANNPRTAMVYRNWYKKTKAEQEAILQQASIYLDSLNEL